MQGDKWTFLVFKGEDSVRQYSLSSRTIRFALGGAAALALLLVGLVGFAGLSGWSRAAMASLDRENDLPR